MQNLNCPKLPSYPDIFYSAPPDPIAGFKGPYMIPLREGRGRRERGEGEGGERYGKVKARNPKGWLTPHVPNPGKYPCPRPTDFLD